MHRLSEDEQQKAKEHMARIGLFTDDEGKACLVCGEDRYQPMYATWNIHSCGGGDVMELFAPTLCVLYVVCPNCGHLLAFSWKGIDKEEDTP
jgi:hypothetical protein